jgi:divalent metal cation (Fe/Co/Zn/Cd) transporter
MDKTAVMAKINHTSNRNKNRENTIMNISKITITTINMIINTTISTITIATTTISMITSTTISTITIMKNMNIISTKAWVCKQQFYTLYVIKLNNLADVIQSIGLLISSILIFFFGSNYGQAVTEWNDWHYLDPISTYIFSIIVICSTFPIVKNCYHIMMESTPSTKVSIEIREEF